MRQFLGPRHTPKHRIFGMMCGSRVFLDYSILTGVLICVVGLEVGKGLKV
jgi:hypothetical protein